MNEEKFTDLSQLEVGDKVFEDSDWGPCSGGARYGLFETVTQITDSEIITDKSVYDKDGYNKTYPMYTIQWFEKKEKE